MKQACCEVCGSVDLIKDGRVFVCQDCGCKYSVEEIREQLSRHLSSEDTAIPKSQNDELISEIETLFKLRRFSAVVEKCDQAINIDPNCAIAYLYKAFSMANKDFPEIDWNKSIDLIRDAVEAAHNGFGDSDQYLAICKELLDLYATFTNSISEAYGTYCDSLSQSAWEHIDATRNRQILLSSMLHGYDYLLDKMMSEVQNPLKAPSGLYDWVIEFYSNADPGNETATKAFELKKLKERAERSTYWQDHCDELLNLYDEYMELGKNLDTKRVLLQYAEQALEKSDPFIAKNDDLQKEKKRLQQEMEAASKRKAMLGIFSRREKIQLEEHIGDLAKRIRCIDEDIAETKRQWRINKTNKAETLRSEISELSQKRESLLQRIGSMSAD